MKKQHPLAVHLVCFRLCFVLISSIIVIMDSLQERRNNIFLQCMAAHVLQKNVAARMWHQHLCFLVTEPNMIRVKLLGWVLLGWHLDARTARLTS